LCSGMSAPEYRPTVQSPEEYTREKAFSQRSRRTDCAAVLTCSQSSGRLRSCSRWGVRARGAATGDENRQGKISSQSEDALESSGVQSIGAAARNRPASDYLYAAAWRGRDSRASVPARGGDRLRRRRRGYRGAETFGYMQLSSHFVMGVTASYATVFRDTAAYPTVTRFLNADESARAKGGPVGRSSVAQYLFGERGAF